MTVTVEVPNIAIYGEKVGTRGPSERDFAVFYVKIAWEECYIEEKGGGEERSDNDLLQF